MKWSVNAKCIALLHRYRCDALCSSKYNLNSINSVQLFLLLSRRSICRNFFTFLFSLSKPSVNEHMIQMCHLNFLYLSFRMHIMKWHVMFNSINYISLASNVTWFVFCVAHAFTLRVKLLWFFFLFCCLLCIASHLFVICCWLNLN